MKQLISLAVAALIAASASLNAQPPKVPSSITFAGETFYFDNSDMYERMDRELLSFAYMHSNSTLMLKRSKRIFSLVEPILKENGLPDDLKYLMAIESNLDPKALSSVGAAGLWQFMTTTAREMGLEVNANIDERYNQEKATRAACKYIKAAYVKMGSWINVVAAYNAGQAGILRRLEVQRQKSAMKLWMNEETSRYIFRVLAAKMMFENPSAFGFNITPADMYRTVKPKEIVIVTAPVENLVDFAQQHGVTYAALKKANLWLREDKLNNASQRTYYVIIPSDE